MESNSERHEREGPETSRIEVVADKTDDGAYEIRVERAPSDAHEAVANLKAAPRPARTRRMHPATVVVIAAAVVALGAGIATAVRSGDKPTPEPTIDAPEPADTFRAFTLEVRRPTAIPIPVLGLDAGTDADELDPEAVAPEPDVAEARGPDAGARSPSTGGAQPEAPSQPTPAPPAEETVEPAILNRLRQVRVQPSAIVMDHDDDEDEDEEYEDDEYDEDYEDDEYDDEDYEDDEYDDEDYEDDDYE